MWFQNIFKVVRAFVRVTDVTINFIYSDLFYFCERVWWGKIRIKKWEQLITDFGQMVNLQLNMSAPLTETCTLFAAVQYDVLYHIEGGLLTAKI